MYEVYCCEMSVKHKEQHQLRHISLYQTLYTMKFSNADLMCVDIYIYIYFTNGVIYNCYYYRHLEKKLATDPSAEHSQIESPTSLYNFRSLHPPRPPPRPRYWDPATSSDGNRGIPRILKDITNIKFPVYTRMYSGQRWTVYQYIVSNPWCNVVRHTIASSNNTRR